MLISTSHQMSPSVIMNSVSSALVFPIDLVERLVNEIQFDYVSRQISMSVLEDADMLFNSFVFKMAADDPCLESDKYVLLFKTGNNVMQFDCVRLVEHTRKGFGQTDYPVTHALLLEYGTAEINGES